MCHIKTMSEEELEAFEVTDYDLENEFNINRPTRKITKNQHIYGKLVVAFYFHFPKSHDNACPSGPINIA